MIKSTSSGGKVVNEVKGSTKEIIADLAAIIISVMQGISGDSPATRALHEKALVTAYLVLSGGDSGMVKFDRTWKEKQDAEES
nr:MAG TPA: hypothetical protein [Caudoviricetes sp.]DAG20254.1 MAG TPA: hypothetical protein [Caudoviricetes sp.]